jgi:translation initiation factor 3 subunit B
LREEHIERFKQFAWRPRPGTLLSKDEQKKIRKNLREYSKTFDEQDFAKKNRANQAVIEQRRRLLDEWKAWRSQVEERVGKLAEGEGKAAGELEVIEEIVEEVMEETEEIVS